MKNILAENLLRFGVRNLSESDIKKIEETVLTEQQDMVTYPGIGNAPSDWIEFSKTNPMLVKQLQQQLLKKPQNDLTPLAIDKYIFVPVNETSGLISTFVAGPYTLPMLTPLTDSVGKYFLQNDFVIAADINIGVFSSKTNPDAKQLAEYVNQMFKILPSNLITTIYNNNPNKSAFDTSIQNVRNSISKTPANEISNLKTIASTLTGNAKAFYNLMPQTAAPTSQPTPQKQ